MRERQQNGNQQASISSLMLQISPASQAPRGLFIFSLPSENTLDERQNIPFRSARVEATTPNYVYNQEHLLLLSSLSFIHSSLFRLSYFKPSNNCLYILLPMLHCVLIFSYMIFYILQFTRSHSKQIKIRFLFREIFGLNKDCNQLPRISTHSFISRPPAK